eukprot:snap_masked-scaffold_3-processed-gene-13.37-mRNA-1 protein AED:1.00 eAED:1.00 QI:0/0/0/0/1/1/2/0/146
MISGNTKVENSNFGKSRINLRVSLNQNNVLENIDINENNFYFITEAEGEYEFCFENLSAIKNQVHFELNFGVQAKDTSVLLSKDAEEVTNLDKKLSDLQKKMTFIKKDLDFWKEEEKKMKKTNEDINSSISFYTIFTILAYGKFIT